MNKRLSRREMIGRAGVGLGIAAALKGQAGQAQSAPKAA